MTLIPCACGCGEFREEFDKRGRPRKYINTHNHRGNHYTKGRHHTDEAKRKIRESRLGPKCPMWKGDDVKYRALHGWIRKHKPIPERCEECGAIKKLEAANVTGVYNRDFCNWRYLCHKCHMHRDGIMPKLFQGQKRILD